MSHNPDMTVADLIFHLQENDWDKDDINKFIEDFGTMTRPEDEWMHCIGVFELEASGTLSLTEGILVWMLAQSTSTDETNVIPSLRAAKVRVARAMGWRVDQVDWNGQLSEEVVDDTIARTFGH